MCGRAFAQSNDLASHKRRTVCSPPEPPTDSISTLYTMETNNLVQQDLQATLNETSNNQVSYINGRLVKLLKIFTSVMWGALWVIESKSLLLSFSDHRFNRLYYPNRQSYHHIIADPKEIQHHTDTIAQPHIQRFGDFQQQFPTTNLLPTFTTTSYR